MTTSLQTRSLIPRSMEDHVTITPLLPSSYGLCLQIHQLLPPIPRKPLASMPRELHPRTAVHPTAPNRTPTKAKKRKQPPAPPPPSSKWSDVPLEIRQIIITHLLNILSCEHTLSETFAAKMHMLRGLGFSFSIDCLRPLDIIVNNLSLEWKAKKRAIKEDEASLHIYSNYSTGYSKRARGDDELARAYNAEQDRLKSIARAQQWIHHIIWKTKKQVEARKKGL